MEPAHSAPKAAYSTQVAQSQLLKTSVSSHVSNFSFFCTLIMIKNHFQNTLELALKSSNDKSHQNFILKPIT
jgi:hypothetical protein